MIPLQFALRRRMMASNSRKKWILTINGTTNSNYLYATKDGVTLAAGTHEIEDGEIIHFVAGSSSLAFETSTFISLDGQKVATGQHSKASTYDLAVHANVTAVGEWVRKLYGTWTLTTI